MLYNRYASLDIYNELLFKSKISDLSSKYII